MKMYRGRLIDHIHIRATELAASQKFYAAILDALAIDYVCDDTHLQADELWIDQGDTPSHIHIAFQTEGKEAVAKFYEAGLKAGGKDNGPPGDRDYHPGYYGAYLLDPDGNNIEAVYHGRAERSAASVELSFGE